MRKGDLGSQLQLSTTEERRTRRFIIKDLSRLYVGIVAALVAVVMSECAENRFCALIGGNPLGIAPLCTISPNAY